MSEKQLSLFSSLAREPARAEHLPSAPDPRTTVPGQQLKSFDTAANILAEHRMPDTSRPLVEHPDFTRLANDTETVNHLFTSNFLEHDPDRAVRTAERFFPAVHVRTADGGYQAGEKEIPFRGMPGDARPEVTEKNDSHVLLAQLARTAPDTPLRMEYHSSDPAPDRWEGSLDPGSIVAADRRQAAHDQKDAARRAGDLRQRQGAVPGPWEAGEVEHLMGETDSGEQRPVTHSSEFPSLHLRGQQFNPAQEQALGDIDTAIGRRETLRQFGNELRK